MVSRFRVTAYLQEMVFENIQVTKKHDPFDAITTVVENMVKKKRSCFPIAILLTTMICSH
jgi:hypothetical protein